MSILKELMEEKLQELSDECREVLSKHIDNVKPKTRAGHIHLAAAKNI